MRGEVNGEGGWRRGAEEGECPRDLSGSMSD